MKKVIFYCLIISLIACGNPIETTNDFNTSAIHFDTTGIKKATPNDYKNSLLLYDDSIIVTTNSNQQKVSFTEINSFVSQHKAELTKSRLNIIATKKASYKTIVNVLDLMAIDGIKQYALLTES